MLTFRDDPDEAAKAYKEAFVSKDTKIVRYFVVTFSFFSAICKLEHGQLYGLGLTLKISLACTFSLKIDRNKTCLFQF